MEDYQFRSVDNKMGKYGVPKKPEAPKVGEYWTHMLTGRVYRFDGENWVATEETVGPDPLGMVGAGYP